MKQSYFSRSRIVAVFFLAATIAACGQGPERDAQGALMAPDSQQTFTNLLLEEAKILRDPVCGLAPDRYRAIIVEIVDRFNLAVVTPQNAPLLVGHPDQEDGIAAIICADGKIAAYAYPKTVVLHDGLLDALADEAMNHTKIVKKGGPTEEWEALFISSVAFVLYHELAHAELDHAKLVAGDDYTDRYAASYIELSADAFGAASVKAAGFSLEGAELVFALLERINPTGAISHPSSIERAFQLYHYGHKMAAAP